MFLSRILQLLVMCHYQEQFLFYGILNLFGDKKVF